MTSGVSKVTDIFKNVMVLAAVLVAIGIFFVVVLVLKKKEMSKDSQLDE